MAFNRLALKAWRESQSLSQTEAAKRFQITQAFLSELETGKKEPSFSMLEAISEKTGIALGDFSTGNPLETSGERSGES